MSGQRSVCGSMSYEAGETHVIVWGLARITRDWRHERPTVDAKGGLEILIDMMSAHGWQKAVDVHHLEP